MPLRGESVGTAYVRIYADGTAVPDGIRDALEDSEPSVRAAGKDHGRAYEEEFNKSVKGSYKKHFQTTQKQMFSDLNESFTDSLARIELADRFFKSAKWKEFTRRLEDEFGDAGRLAGKELEKEFRDNTNLDRLVDEMDRIGPRVRRAQEQLLADLHAEALQMNKDFDRKQRQLNDQYEVDFERHLERLNQQWRDMYDEAYRMHVDFNRREKALRDQYDADFERSAERNVRAAESLWRSMEKIDETVRRIGRGERTTFDRSDLLKMLGELDSAMHKLDTNVFGSSQNLHDWDVELDRVHRQLNLTTPSISRFSGRIERAGDVIGKLFGKGSRNDFLNFVGTVAGGLVQIFRVIPEGVAWFTRLGRSMDFAFKSKGGGIGGVLAALGTGASGVATALASATAAGVAFVAFLGVFSVVVGPVVALLSGLVGIVVALAASISFALVGAIGALLPILPVLGFALGGIIATVLEFKNASDDLKAGIREVNKVAGNLFQTFRDRAFVEFPSILERGAKFLGQLHPLAKAAGDGFSDLAVDITDAFTSPALARFLDRLTIFLPHAMDDLGKIVGNLTRGIAGIFIGAIPSAQSFLDWLVKITDRFAKWANSGRGQQEIERFFNRAEHSLSAIWEFVKKVWDFTVKLLDAGQGTGDNIFERMAGAIEKAAKFFEDNPDALKDWFKHAEDTAVALGDLIDGLNNLLDILDDPTNRKIATQFVSILGDALTGLGVLLDEQSRFTGLTIGLLRRAVTGIADWAKDTRTLLEKVGGAVWYIVGGAWVGDLLHGISDGLSAAGGFIAEQARRFWDWVDNTFIPGGNHGIGANIISMPAVTRAVTQVIEAVGRIPGRVAQYVREAGHAWAPLAATVRSFVAAIPGQVAGIFGRIPSAVSRVVSQVGSAWNGLQERIMGFVRPAVNAVETFFENLPGNLAHVPGDIVGLFTGLAGRIIAAIGPIIIHPTIDWPDLHKGTAQKAPDSAEGGMFFGPQVRRIGEAGPEAVVPLNRPLSQVDPAVRALSAFAQGLDGGTTTSNSRTIDVGGIQIITPTRDPAVVARETVDALVASLM